MSFVFLLLAGFSNTFFFVIVFILTDCIFTLGLSGEELPELLSDDPELLGIGLLVFPAGTL